MVESAVEVAMGERLRNPKEALKILKRNHTEVMQKRILKEVAKGILKKAILKVQKTQNLAHKKHNPNDKGSDNGISTLSF